jgi:hypothetical protein
MLGTAQANTFSAKFSGNGCIHICVGICAYSEFAAPIGMP